MTEATADPLGAAVADAIERTLPTVVDRIADHVGPRAFTVAEAARALKISERSVYRLVADGRIAIIPHLSIKRIAASALDDFMRGRTA